MSKATLTYVAVFAILLAMALINALQFFPCGPNDGARF